MAYIGVSPSNGVRRVHTYTATASQTTFSGAGAEGTSLSYKDSNFVDVYQNGIKLGDADYTSTSGTSIVLAQGASVSDLVVVVVFDVFSVADTVSKADGGTFDGNVTMAGTLGVTGATTLTGGVSGNTTFTGDIGVGDDVNLTSDSSQITFGADSEVILAHTADTGLTLQGSGLNTNFSLLAFHTTDGTVPDLRLGKSSSNTIGTFAETANGEALGQIRFTGQDSNNAARSGGAIAVEQTASSTGSTVPSAMTFSTTGSEAMRILSNGDVAINSTTTSTSGFSAAQVKVGTDSGRNSITVESNRQNSVAYGVHADGSTGTRYALYILNGAGGEVGKISYTSSETTYATTSDYRLKENVSYDFDATTRLKQLKPCRFNFIVDADTTVDGFLAHEVSPIVPQAILGEKDATKEDGSVDPQSIDQAKLVPLLVKTIQELEARITALENAE